MAEPKDAIWEPSIAQPTTGIVFKGYRSGLILIIPETGPFDSVLRELEEHLIKSHSFFKNAKVSVQTGRRILTSDEQEKIARILQDYDLILQQFTNSVSSLGGREVRSISRSDKPENNDFIDTITVKKTVRSGQKIQFEGNLLIIGDVNPGAEVIASGDIVVLGKLRGIAHAGANGDESAQIFALQFNPVQIRIAGIFTRDSDRGKGFKIKTKNISPEVARIKDHLIVVEHY